MLVERRRDQADGLRRMFAGERLRVIDIVAGRGGVGCLSVSINLAAALARLNRDTLLVDAAGDDAPARVFSYLGLEPQASVADEARFAAGVVAGPYGLAVAALNPRIGLAPARRAQFMRFCAPLEFVLLSGSLSPLADSLGFEHDRREVIVVLSPAATSITEAYALIKRLSAATGQRHFRVLVNQAHDGAQAMRIYRNMARVAHGFLDVQLDYFGFVPFDAALVRAHSQGRCLFALRVQSPAATALMNLARDIAAWPSPSVQAESRRPRYGQGRDAA
jgi:flagellar biosynthesis protein FlhG